MDTSNNSLIGSKDEGEHCFIEVQDENGTNKDDDINNVKKYFDFGLEKKKKIALKKETNQSIEASKLNSKINQRTNFPLKLIINLNNFMINKVT